MSWFCLNIRKCFFSEFSFWSQQKEHMFFQKRVLGILKIVPRLRDQHVFMWQSVKVSNVFHALTLKQIFWKAKTFFQKLEYHFSVEPLRLKTHHFHSKLVCQRPMLRQIKKQKKNGSITKKGFLPITALFIWKICSGFRTS